MKRTFTAEQVRQWAAKRTLCRVLGAPVESIECWGEKQKAQDRAEAARNQFRLLLGVRV